MRTDNVSSTVPNEVHSRYCGLLGVSSHVTRDQTQQRNERRWTGLCQVVASQSPGVVTQGKSNHEQHTNDGSTHTNHRYENAVAVFVACPATRDEKDDFDCAAGRTVEQRLLLSVAEADNELREEV